MPSRNFPNEGMRYYLSEPVQTSELLVFGLDQGKRIFLITDVCRRELTS